ncbi:MAG: tetratricopeptide repeat protein [Candidatus Omnitrophica bacterium]|nr:tetratricopeptide repeat protein [Candidatus Omnitrophota bacterium]
MLSKKFFGLVFRNIVFIASIIYIVAASYSFVFAESAFKNNKAPQCYQQALIEQHKGNVAEAFALYQQAILLENDNPVVLNEMGVAAEQAGFPDKAEQFYLRAKENDPGYLPVYMNLAYLYLGRGERSLAARFFRERYERSGPHDMWGEKAKTELLKIDPQYQNVILQKESLNLNVEVTRKIQQAFSADVEQAQQHFNSGQKAFQSGQFETAMTEYAEAFKLSPDDPKIWQANEAAAAALKKKENAERAQKAIELLKSGDYSAARDEIKALESGDSKALNIK